MKILVLGRFESVECFDALRERLVKVNSSKHGPFHMAIAFTSKSSCVLHKTFPIPVYGTSSS
jgi:hypothetical protein